MKVVINGIEHNDPSSIHVYVDEKGETRGPILIQFHGGPLTVESSGKRAAITAKGDHVPFLLVGGNNGCGHITVDPMRASIANQIEQCRSGEPYGN